MFEPKPESLEICGALVAIDPDFRIMCEYSSAVSESNQKEAARLARRFYPRGLPGGVSAKAAAKAMTDFYVSGLAPKAAGKKSSVMSASEPCFDFSEDEAYFYAAFMAYYHIDLNVAKLHWLDFCALFRGLPDECRLKRIIGIRAESLSAIKSSAEKARVSRLKRIYSLKRREKKFESVSDRNAAMIEEMRRIHEKAHGKGGENI